MSSQFLEIYCVRELKETFNVFILQVTFGHQPIILFWIFAYEFFFLSSLEWCSHILGVLQFGSRRRKGILENLLYWIRVNMPWFYRELLRLS